MDTQSLSMYLTMTLTFALGIVLYAGIFVYSFKRKRHFWIRLGSCILALGGISTGVAFAMYGLFRAGLNADNILHVDTLRATMYLLFLVVDIIVLAVCFDEKPSLILFATVAATAAHTIGTMIYDMLALAFQFDTIYFTMYTGYSVAGFVLYFVTHIAVLALCWLLFGWAFAKSHKDFGSQINKFILGVYVMYAFFTVAISGSQFFNMRLGGINSVAIPLIFDGFSVFFAVFVLFVQRFNLIWVRDVQAQEAAQNFHQFYKEKADKQQANMALVNQKLDDIKDQVAKIVAKYHIDKAILDELATVSSDIFDSSIQTGNDALDMLLTQKSLGLNANHIKTTAMLDGSALSFMDVEDVNVFFGNALDNAIEYLGKVDEEKRFVRISSTRNKSLLLVRIENYCEQDVAFAKDGRPISSSKSGSVSYGTHSIRAVAEKYGGTATFAREGNLFVVTALFSACEAN